MRQSRQRTRKFLLRIYAAMFLTVWIGSLFFCSANCSSEKSHSEPHHHAKEVADSHHDHDQAPDSNKHSDCNNSFCDSLKTFVHSTGDSFITKARFSLTYTLAFVSPSQTLAVPQSETPIFRQAYRRDWAFTPEVYLGPAFRSHAPPVSSVA